MLLPPPEFAKVALDLAPVGPDLSLQRIFLARHPNPLGFGKTPSRFSDPRELTEADRFGVLYLGSTLKVCFLEAILRDQRNGRVGDFPLEETELRAKSVAEIVATRTLNLVELRGDGPVRMGIPSDVARGSDQTLARAWALALYEHPAAVDGIVYQSRLNGEDNVAIFDRALPSLRAVKVEPLMATRDLASVLNDLKVAIL